MSCLERQRDSLLTLLKARLELQEKNVDLSFFPEEKVSDRGFQPDFLFTLKGRKGEMATTKRQQGGKVSPGQEECRELAVLVEKTGGAQEHAAFDFLSRHLQQVKEAE